MRMFVPLLEVFIFARRSCSRSAIKIQAVKVEGCRKYEEDEDSKDLQSQTQKMLAGNRLTVEPLLRLRENNGGTVAGNRLLREQNF